MAELIFLKLGGSVITDKTRPFTVRQDVIRRLGREMKLWLDQGPEHLLVVGHGSGSFGHAVAHQYQTQKGNIHADSWLGFAETGAAAARLNRIVIDLLLEEGVPAVSFQPSASAWCRKGKLTALSTHALKQVLAVGLCPVVYGDVAIDEVKGFTIISTEQIFGYLAHELSPTRIVLAGVVDGVYNADPLADSAATRYERITPANWSTVELALGGSHATDVTGGMLSKVRSMLDLAQGQASLEIHIVSGEIPNHTAQALSGKLPSPGTLLSSQDLG